MWGTGEQQEQPDSCRGQDGSVCLAAGAEPAFLGEAAPAESELPCPAFPWEPQPRGATETSYGVGDAAVEVKPCLESVWVLAWEASQFLKLFS